MTHFEALKAAHERKIAQNPTTIQVDRTGEEIVVRLVPGGRVKQQVQTATAGIIERSSWTMLLPAGADVVASTSTTSETFATAAGQEFEVWEVRILAVEGQEWGRLAECVEMS